jgi:DNA repair photolyase
MITSPTGADTLTAAYTNRLTQTINPDGVSIKGCSYIYAPAGQAGEYAPLACNPYRGCGHKCSYCLDGDTLISMADGSTRTIKDIRVGDQVIGIVTRGHARAWTTRIKTAEVLAILKTIKLAYRVTLSDGRSVICSADHRWLTERGWKYTTDGDIERSHLTVNNSIRDIGRPVLTPPLSLLYMTGYLAGIISGDANLAVYDYSARKRPSGKMMGKQYRFRLALKDGEALDRAAEYLEAVAGIKTNRVKFNNGHNPNHAPMEAIQTTSPQSVIRIMELSNPFENIEWKRGWLAGIFDAEGSHSGAVIRISNTDERILSLTEEALADHGFDYVREKQANRSVSYVRVVGGRPVTNRFWQLVDPAIKRKFSLKDRAICNSVKVVSIEPLDQEIEMFDLMTDTETFIANGLVSHNCYVPAVLEITRAEFDAGAVQRPDFIKHLQHDAAKYQAAGIKGQVMLSFTTDPYHPGENMLTRAVLQNLIDYGLSFCTLTKGGARALRDLDLFRPAQDAFASTLTTLDDAFSLKWERGAALPGDRIATLRKFHDAGIFTWVSLEPTLNTESSLAIVEHTHQFVDLYKIGRANYLPMTKSTDWQDYTLRMIDLCQRLNVRHYIKKDLQPYLPEGYYNPRRIPQHNGHTEPTPALDLQPALF